MGILSRLLGLPQTEPIKMMRPTQDYQAPPMPMIPTVPLAQGGAPGPQPMRPQAPPMSPDLELKIAGDPLSQLQWQQGDAPLDMSNGQIQRGVGGPQRGMEPLSAPQGIPQLDLGADMRAAMMRAQAQPQSDPMLDWYRSEGQRDLNNLQEGRDYYSRSAQDYESRLGRTDRRRWW